jgi:hypothetical protein
MERIEVALENGVLGFDSDGEVVEAFGFTTGTSNRIPVSQIKEIDVRKGAVTISCGGRNIMPLTIPLSDGEAESEELIQFLDYVKTNALIG